MTAMRETTLTAEAFYEKFEQECFLKHSRLNDEEQLSLYIEWGDLTTGGEWK